MSRENARRNQSNQLIAAAAVAAIAGSASLAAAQVTVDGSRDGTYGSAITLQTVQTQFGDANPGGGSELDGAYARIENGTLYTMMTGNLEGNFNKYVYFFDTRAGGQNVMRNDNPGNDFNAMAKYAGMTFDAGFSPDYAMWFGHDNTTAYLHFAELNTNGGGFGAEVGSIALSGGIGAATLGGTAGLPRVQFGFNNNNTAGVVGGTDAADQTAAAAVTTGAEIAIELPQLGALGNLKVMVGVNGGGHDYWSNQFLAGLTAPQGNLGSDGTGAGNGSVGGVNFNNFAGDQFFTVNYTAPAVREWNSAGGGNWTEAAKWTGAVVPNAVDDRALLGQLGGAGARVITLNTNVRLQSLTFDNPGGYTIAAGGGSLTIAGNASLPAVVVTSGNHTIAAPLHLGATTNFGIAASTSLNVQNLVANNQPVVKTGGGVLQVNTVRTNVLNVQEGTVRIATNGSNSGGSEVSSLDIAGGLATPTATLDLTDNDLIVRNGNPDNTGTLAANIVSAITTARNGGSWNGTGITSSAAAAATPKNKTLGSLTGAEYLTVQPAGTFGDFTATANDVLVKFTYYGDTDLNGQVNFDDYSRIDAGFNNNRTGWFNGDFDYSGQVNFDDYALIDLAFNTQSGTLIRAMDFLEGEDRNYATMNTPELQKVVDHFAEFGNGYATSFLNAVPEPTSALALSAIGALSLKRRRRAR